MCKKLKSLFLILGLGFVINSCADGYTGYRGISTQKLYVSCRSKAPEENAFCYGYISGVYDGMSPSCLEVIGKIDPDQIAASFIQYVDKHPGVSVYSTPSSLISLTIIAKYYDKFDKCAGKLEETVTPSKQLIKKTN